MSIYKDFFICNPSYSVNVFKKGIDKAKTNIPKGLEKHKVKCA